MTTIETKNITIQLINPGHKAGEKITGYIILKIEEPKRITKVFLEVKGKTQTYYTETSTRFNSEGKIEVNSYKVYLKDIMYASPQFEVFDEKHGKMKPEIGEYQPGIHTFPFEFELPFDLQSSVTLKDEMFCCYEIQASVIFITASPRDR